MNINVYMNACVCLSQCICVFVCMTLIFNYKCIDLPLSVSICMCIVGFSVGVSDLCSLGEFTVYIDITFTFGFPNICIVLHL